MLAPDSALRIIPAAALQPTLHSLAMRPLAISASVRDALAFGDPMVVAGHGHGASLVMTGTDDAVFMSAPGPGLLPAHVVVRARDLERVLDAFESGAALTLHLDLDGVRTFHPRLAPGSVDMGSVRARANVAALAQCLRSDRAPLGLGATAAEVLAPGGRWLHCAAGMQHGRRSAERALRTLVGFGAGTTPAGDDFALGALAYAWVSQGPEASVITAMRSLETELSGLTTATGATYLKAAARGDFGSHLVAWVRALPHVSPSRALALALRVAGHGATSGSDTLAGFVAAALAAGAMR